MILEACGIDSENFDYLTSEKRAEISRNILLGKTHCIKITNPKSKDLVAVIDKENDSVHVREVNGPITTTIKYLEKYCLILCDIWGIKKITFCTERKVITKVGKTLGYKEDENFKGEFYKVIE